MSAADLLEDSIPHGTRAGYQAGCKTEGGCPAGKEFGLSCNRANMLAVSDYSYQKLARENLAPSVIAERMGITPVGAAPKPRKPRARTSADDDAAADPEPLDTADDDLQLPDPDPDAAVSNESQDAMTSTPTRAPRRTAKRAPRRAPKPASKHVPVEFDAPTSTEVRAWAVANGVAVTSRGRVGQGVIDAFLDAHPERQTAPKTTPVADTAEVASGVEAPAPLVAPETEPAQEAVAAHTPPLGAPGRPERYIVITDAKRDTSYLSKQDAHDSTFRVMAEGTASDLLELARVLNGADADEPAVQAVARRPIADLPLAASSAAA